MGDAKRLVQTDTFCSNDAEVNRKHPEDYSNRWSEGTDNVPHAGWKSALTVVFMRLHATR
jgi:hypothetical protein